MAHQIKKQSDKGSIHHSEDQYRSLPLASSLKISAATLIPELFHTLLCFEDNGDNGDQVLVSVNHGQCHNELLILAFIRFSQCRSCRCLEAERRNLFPKLGHKSVPLVGYVSPLTLLPPNCKAKATDTFFFAASSRTASRTGPDSTTCGLLGKRDFHKNWTSRWTCRKSLLQYIMVTQCIAVEITWQQIEKLQHPGT